MKNLPTPTLHTLTGGSIPDYEGGTIYCPFPFPDDDGTIGCPGPGSVVGNNPDGCFGTGTSSY